VVGKVLHGWRAGHRMAGWVRISLLILGAFVLLTLLLTGVSQRAGDAVSSASITSSAQVPVEFDERQWSGNGDESPESPPVQPRTLDVFPNADPGANPLRETAPVESEVGRSNDSESFADRSDDDESDGDEVFESIAGTVFDDGGDILPGIEITLFGLDAESGAMPGRSVRSDRLGMFRFERIASGEYEVRALGADRYHSLSQRVRAGIGNLELHLQSKGNLIVQGRVTDEQGRAIVDSRVRALGGGTETRSANDGSYRMVVERRQANQPPVLVFSHPQFREHRAQLSGSPSQGVSPEIDLDVTLKSRTAGVRLEGLISGPSNEVVSGVSVWLNAARPGSYRRTVTDAFGLYAFEKVESDESYRIGVDGNRDYAPSEPQWVSVGGQDEVFDVRLRRRSAGEVHGTLVNPEGSVLPEFAVRLKSSGASDRYPLELRSDRLGGFRIGEIEAGQLLFMTTSVPLLQAHGLVLEPGANRYVEVVLDWGDQWLFGRVVDAQDRPVAGARVTAQWGMQFGDVFSQSQRETRTDIEGNFAFSNLAASGYMLTVRAEGHSSARVFHAMGNGSLQDLVITMARM
jgi:hypothetical protein